MDTSNRLHGRRAEIAGAAGAAGLCIATIAGNRFVVARVTPDADGETATDATTEPTRQEQAEVAARYDDFVSWLSTSLGLTDSASVDTGTRNALSGMVHARLAAGAISANDVEAVRTAIASTLAPLVGLMILGGRRRGRGHGGFGDECAGFGRPEDDDTETEEVLPATPSSAV